MRSMARAAAAGILVALVSPLPTSQGVASAACLPNAIPPESRKNIDGLHGNTSIPFGIWAGAWDSAMLVAQVVRILAEEAIGYNATISGLSGSSFPSLYAVAGCLAPHAFATDPQCGGGLAFVHHATFEVWVSREMLLAVMRQHLTQIEAIPEEAGYMGYDGVGGTYLMAQQRQEAYAAEGLALEFYTAYDAAWQRPANYFDKITAFDSADLKPCYGSNTHFEFAAANQLYLQVTGDHDGVVRSPDGSLRARCWNSSWWLAPACRSDPENCVPLITAAEGWSLLDIMQQAAVFNMPVAITITRTVPLWMTTARSRRSLLVWWQPDAAFIDLQPYIVTFPPHNALEWEQGIRYTMPNNQRLTKWMHRQFGLRASRLRELVRRVSFTKESINDMLLERVLRTNWTHEDVACDWLRRNEQIWRRWIPEETECSQGKGLVSSDGSFERSRANASTCAWCPPGKSSAALSDDTGITHICLDCDPGRSQSDPGHQECGECAAGTVTEHYGSRECQQCDFGKFVGTVGQSECDQCAPTFITNFRGATTVAACICPEGSYRVRGQQDSCQPCQEGMECPQGSDTLGYLSQHAEEQLIVPLLRPGFWSSIDEPLSVFRCADTARCPGGTVPGEACAEGFELRGCSACQAGLVQSGSRCVPCPTGAVQILLFPVAPLAATVAIISLLYLSGGVPYNKWDSWKSGAAASVFIMLNYFHIANVLYSLDPISGGSASSTFEIVAVMSDLLSMFKPQCGGFRTFMSQLILHSHGPGVLFLVFLGLWLVSKLFAVCHQALKIDTNRLLNTYFSLILTFFTRVADMCFTTFKCADNPNGAYTLIQDRSIICYEGSWNEMVLVGLVAVLIWCVGFGALLLHAVCVAPQRFHIASFQTRWTFLFVRYRPDRHWWSLTVMAKGIFLNLGSLFLRSGVAQICWILIVLVVYAYASAMFQPWRHVCNNAFDNFAHLSLCVVTAISIWLSRVENGEEQKAVVMTLLGVNMAAAAAPLIPIVVVMWWRERSQRARGKKETDARLFLHVLKLVGEASYERQLALLSSLTHHDFRLICQTKDLLLTECLHKKVRSGYAGWELARMSKQSVHRMVSDEFKTSMSVVGADEHQDDCRDSKVVSACPLESEDAGADAASLGTNNAEKDNEEDISDYDEFLVPANENHRDPALQVQRSRWGVSVGSQWHLPPRE